MGREAIWQTDVESGDEDPEGEPADDEGDDEDAHLDENSALAHPFFNEKKRTQLGESNLATVVKKKFHSPYIVPLQLKSSLLPEL